jgi:hypothetical protein
MYIHIMQEVPTDVRGRRQVLLRLLRRAVRRRAYEPGHRADGGARGSRHVQLQRGQPPARPPAFPTLLPLLLRISSRRLPLRLIYYYY